ncbi:hypothetical protein EVJ58_g9283 [Rhodofomes roseus]|uniref:Uncharacterized protein n=1 Tax=Rhodofomes roseus TaxID=34475 RepID=A0A4Y9XWC2_9APHY|nr:hypothetical protein EVJ58_g9283 [Rhodofomes roseus]
MSASAKTGSYTDTFARSWGVRTRRRRARMADTGKTHDVQVLAYGKEEGQLGARVTRRGRAAQAKAEHVWAPEG